MILRGVTRHRSRHLLFAYELDHRLRAAELDVESVACHLGYAATELQCRSAERRGSPLRAWAMELMNTLFAQSATEGALPVLYAATHPEVEGGQYVGPGGFTGLRGDPHVQRSSAASYDREAARRLWVVSEELTGITYGFDRSTGPRAKRLTSDLANRWLS